MWREGEGRASRRDRAARLWSFCAGGKWLVELLERGAIRGGMEEMEKDEQRRGETGAVIGNASMIGREDEQRWMASGFDPSTRANFRSLEQARVDRRPGPLAVRETQRKPSASGMRCGLDGKLSRLTRATGAGIVWRRAEILLLQPATSTTPSQMWPVAKPERQYFVDWMDGSAGQDWIEQIRVPSFWCGGLNCQSMR